MNLTIRDALIKGIEAHKAGKIREADQFYTLILTPTLCLLYVYS